MKRFNLWQLNGTPIDTLAHKHANRFAILTFFSTAGSTTLDNKKKLVSLNAIVGGKG